MYTNANFISFTPHVTFSYVIDFALIKKILQPCYGLKLQMVIS